MSRCHSFYCISHSSDLMNKYHFAVCRWIWSSPKSSQMVHGTWSPSCSATIQMIVSHYRVSLTIRGCAQTPAESCPQSAQPRNPEPTWPAYLTLRVFYLSFTTNSGQACFGFTAMGFKLPLFWHILWWKCIPTFLYCTVRCHYLCLVCCLEVFCVFYCHFFSETFKNG